MSDAKTREANKVAAAVDYHLRTREQWMKPLNTDKARNRERVIQQAKIRKTFGEDIMNFREEIIEAIMTSVLYEMGGNPRSEKRGRSERLAQKHQERHALEPKFRNKPRRKKSKKPYGENPIERAANKARERYLAAKKG